MKMRLIISLIILLASVTCYGLDIVTEFRYDKQINNNAGMEFLIKGTIPIDDSFDLKWGMSEGYTAFRGSPYSMNHAGHRLDIGFLWYAPWDFKFGYTHSVRSWFEGANPKDLYDYDSVDSFVFRKEFRI